LTHCVYDAYIIHMQVVDRKVQHGKKVLVGPGFVPTILGFNDS
jgi:hypothetical protein